MNFNRLVIISYRLPFKITRKQEGYRLQQNAGGLVSAILSLSKKIYAQENKINPDKIIWIGKSDNTEIEFSQTLFNDTGFDIHPVFLESSLHKKYYNGFCNDTIWPLFHYFLPSITSFDESYFNAYFRVHQIFLEKIKKIVRPDDFIWVHDYQLFLLPSMLRDIFPLANIAFFLHIPFPSFETFRLIPKEWRFFILKGMLGADLIGFHTNDYVQHFLKSVRRTFKISHSLNTLFIDDRIIRADTLPIGIDYDKFNEALTTPEVEKERKKLQKEITNKFLVFSVDRLDYSKGLINRLLSFERFIELYPEWIGKVVYNMVVVPSREGVVRYQEMKKEIEANVGRINGKYSSLSWRPLIYQYKSLGFHELVALYDISRVALITPIRDGMNLVAKEYIACQKMNIGVLILSEMAGAAAELGEALIVNPNDKTEIANALNKALLMTESERTDRIFSMQQRIKEYNVYTWADDNFNTMKKLKEEQKKLNKKIINPFIIEDLKTKYKKSGKRIIFLDYDGTMVPIQRTPELAIPDNIVNNIMKKMIADQKNKVVLITGRNIDFIDMHFSGLDMDIIAEHGAFIKKAKALSWTATTTIDTTWKSYILPILNRYSNHCTGAFTEIKKFSLAWHYRNADSDLAALRVTELREELKDALSSDLHLQVIDGHKVLEIKNADYNKGKAILEFLHADPFDFIMAIGDDKTDEDIFISLPDNALSFKVGLEPSKAKYYFKLQQEVIEFLYKLID